MQMNSPHLSSWPLCLAHLLRTSSWQVPASPSHSSAIPKKLKSALGNPGSPLAPRYCQHWMRIERINNCISAVEQFSICNKSADNKLNVNTGCLCPSVGSSCNHNDHGQKHSTTPYQGSTSSSAEGQVSQAQWTHSVNPFHFRKNSTFPLTIRWSKTFSTTNSSGSSTSFFAFVFCFLPMLDFTRTHTHTQIIQTKQKHNYNNKTDWHHAYNSELMFYNSFSSKYLDTIFIDLKWNITIFDLY